MPRLRKYCAESFMNFSLEWLEWDPLAIYADETIFLVLGNDAVSKNFAVPDTWHVKKVTVFYGKHHFHRVDAADVTVDTDQIHESIVW